MEGIHLKDVDAAYDFNIINAQPIDFSDSAYSKSIVLSTATADRLKLKAGNEAMLTEHRPARYEKR